jgi:hypothetical protein
VLVSEGSEVQIASPTLVSITHGTDFIVVYDPQRDSTDVVGLNGRVEVEGRAPRSGKVVFVTAHYMTTVARNGDPSGPDPIDDATLEHYLEGLDFIGGGKPESQTVGHPVLNPALTPREGPTAWGPVGPPSVPGEPYPEPRDPGDLLPPPFPVFGGLRIRF